MHFRCVKKTHQRRLDISATSASTTQPTGWSDRGLGSEPCLLRTQRGLTLMIRCQNLQRRAESRKSRLWHACFAERGKSPAVGRQLTAQTKLATNALAVASSASTPRSPVAVSTNVAERLLTAMSPAKHRARAYRGPSPYHQTPRRHPRQRLRIHPHLKLIRQHRCDNL